MSYKNGVIKVEKQKCYGLRLYDGEWDQKRELPSGRGVMISEFGDSYRAEGEFRDGAVYNGTVFEYDVQEVWGARMVDHNSIIRKEIRGGETVSSFKMEGVKTIEEARKMEQEALQSRSEWWRQQLAIHRKQYPEEERQRQQKKKQEQEEFQRFFLDKQPLAVSAETDSQVKEHEFNGGKYVGEKMSDKSGAYVENQPYIVDYPSGYQEKSHYTGYVDKNGRPSGEGILRRDDGLLIKKGEFRNGWLHTGKMCSYDNLKEKKAKGYIVVNEYKDGYPESYNQVQASSLEEVLGMDEQQPQPSTGREQGRRHQSGRAQESGMDTTRYDSMKVVPYTDAKGGVYVGEVGRRGQPKGSGIFTDKDGRVYVGEYNNGRTATSGDRYHTHYDNVSKRNIVYKIGVKNIGSGGYGKPTKYGSIEEAIKTEHPVHYPMFLLEKERKQQPGKDIRIVSNEYGHYIGEVDSGGGHGTFIYSDNGDVYEGEMKNGKPFGHGKLTKKDGKVFDGEFNGGRTATRDKPSPGRPSSRLQSPSGRGEPAIDFVDKGIRHIYEGPTAMGTDGKPRPYGQGKLTKIDAQGKTAVFEGQFRGSYYAEDGYKYTEYAKPPAGYETRVPQSLLPTRSSNNYSNYQPRPRSRFDKVGRGGSGGGQGGRWR
ncbi:hypothetical protein FACS1894152_4040 [Bacilli bacterium]|nr:hypothetical protein FACS1894152_4040 [Bacilli bacterium]